ncbi:MAG: two-component system, OmpR family, response regulator [Gaiellales bacterium]|nr:two-component system, OmpR family, response regulator [Gaiellales bacterium]
MPVSTLLVVDDEPRIIDFLVENLEADDYAVLTATSGEEALDVLANTDPDLLLLDVVMPGLSGYDVCRRVRGGDAVNDPWDPDVPIIMLSAKAEHTDRVRGLDRGADDYVTKPFHYPELLARIAGLLWRASRSDTRTQFRIEELVVDTLAKRVTVAGQPVALSVKEFQLLATLASNPDKVFSKRELLEQVWDFKSHGRTRTLDSHASRLRQKLAEHSDRQWVVNVWGHGYRITAPE